MRHLWVDCFADAVQLEQFEVHNGVPRKFFDFNHDVGFYEDVNEVSFSFCFMFLTAQGDNDGGWL